ncbi:MAG: isoprenylcysteine carboxylmethyltransferase family protein [Sedimentisphaerales bacterium]|nr:isoprenylcysteine carboxylmethyltransferase family protein [Sedimentisphaerales bacterium]
MLNFSDLKIRFKRPDLMHWLVNIVVASFFSYYVYDSIIRLATGTCVTLLIALLFRNTSITLVFLLRRPSKLTSRNVGDWIAAIGGTFITYLYTSQAKPIYPFIVPTAYLVMIVTAFLSTIGIINLGRSFGLVPANRGIKTDLLYGIVRHPLYLLYTIYDLAVISLAFSLHNCCICILHALFSYLRAKREESILMQDITYQEYASKTRYMFLPGVL